MRRATYSDCWSTAPKHAWFGERTIKALLFFAALATAVLALLVLVASVSADTSKTKGRIDSLARKSYIFKIQPHKGAVSLTGLVSEEFHKSLADETIPHTGVKLPESGKKGTDYRA